MPKKQKPQPSVISIPKPCRIVDPTGNVYHPTQAPELLCRCGVMLDLKPRKEDYVFSSKIRATHAKEHTIKYLKLIGSPFFPDDYRIEEVES